MTAGVRSQNVRIAMRVLLVEDDNMIGHSLRQALTENGLSVDWVRDGVLAQDALAQGAYSAVLLDLGLPRRSGLEVLRRARQEGNRTPMLVLTARDGLDDRVSGLDLGADDYLVKPFAFEELAARLEALLRRPGQLLGRALHIANLAFDTESRQAFINDKPQVLSARETSVLELLMRCKDRVVSKKLVEDQIFGLSSDIASNAVEVYVHRLRKQLSERGARVQIHTIRGVGYLMSEERAA